MPVYLNGHCCLLFLRVICRHFSRKSYWQFVATCGRCMMELQTSFRDQLAVSRCFVSQSLDLALIIYGIAATVPRPQPLNYFLLEYLKAFVYRGPVLDANSLLQRIVNRCYDICTHADAFHRLGLFLVMRVEAFIVPNGSHFKHLL